VTVDPYGLDAEGFAGLRDALRELAESVAVARRRASSSVSAKSARRVQFRRFRAGVAQVAEGVENARGSRDGEDLFSIVLPWLDAKLAAVAVTLNAIFVPGHSGAAASP
jgi:hypothetical protein